MDSARLEKLGRRLLSRAPLVGGRLRRRSLHALTADGSPEAAAALADALVCCAESDWQERLRESLLSLSEPGARDAVCAAWAGTRHPALAGVVATWGHVAAAPAPLRVLTILFLNREDDLTGAGAGVVPPLLAACDDKDLEIAGRARLLLCKLSDPAAQAALCQHVLAVEDPAACEAARAGGYAPAEPDRRALFYFLTGQWAVYEKLDFDRGLLRMAYEAAPPPLRRRIADVARRAGRAELVEILAGGAGGRRLGEMSVAEWAVTLDVLERNGAWPRLWQLAQAAPPRWADDALRRLGRAGWAPAEPEQAVYRELSGLAEGWDASDLGPAEACWAVLTGHGGPIDCLAVSPDGRLLAAGGGGTAVSLWELPGGIPAGRFEGHAETVNCLAFGPDGGMLASGGDDQTVRLWKLPAGDRCRVLRGCTGRVTALAWTPDGKTLVSLSRDFAQVWDLTEDQPEGKPLRQGGMLICLAISPDGEVLATGSADGRVWLSWHLPHGELQEVLEWHAGPVTDLAFSADGRALASASRDGTVRLWEVGGGRRLRDLPRGAFPPDGADFLPDRRARMGRRRQRVTGLWPLPDSRLLAARAAGRSVCLFTPGDGRTVQTFTGHTGAVTCLAASPSRQGTASGSTDGTVRLWGQPSRLARLAHAPLSRVTLEDWDWVRGRLGEHGLGAAERAALRFLDALLRHRWRTDVEVEEAAARWAGGAFDVEVEG